MSDVSRERWLVVGKAAPDRGGIAAYLRGFLASGTARRHRAELVNLAHTEAREGGRLSAGNARRTSRDVVRTWRAAGRADVLHVHTAGAPLVTAGRAGALALAGRARGCRVVVHVHGGKVESSLTSRWARLATRIALTPAHSVVAVSSGVARELARALGTARVTLVDNGVDPSAYGEPEPPHEPPRILYVGLLTPRKGVLDLLAASRALRLRGIDHDLWLVGGTPDEGPEAEEQISRALTSGVLLLGELPPEQLPAIYAQADLLCLPSWWEAMPLSVLEAMAAGLPVVASDVGDVSRLVLDEVTGLLVPPRDVPALEQALERLLVDPATRVAWGRAGRARARDDFSAERSWSCVEAVLEGRAR